MKITKQYTLGDVTFTVTEGTDMAELRIAKKMFLIPMADMKAFAQAFLGPQIDTAPIVSPRPVSNMDTRKADSSVPLKRLTREDLAAIDRPVMAPPGVFAGLSAMSEPSFLTNGAKGDVIQFGKLKK